MWVELCMDMSHSVETLDTLGIRLPDTTDTRQYRHKTLKTLETLETLETQDTTDTRH